jgi:hypothetical protein
MAKLKRDRTPKMQSELLEEGELPTRHQAKIFLASPSDVKAYREATQSVVDTLNMPFTRTGKQPLFLYTWEGCKLPGYTEDYQKDIFQEFGFWCDAFILLLWHRIGEGGTEREYNAFIDVFRENNPDIRLYVALIREPIDPYRIDPEQLCRLQKFVNQHQDKWAVLGRTRDAIKSVEDYQNELTSELSDFMRCRVIL